MPAMTKLANKLSELGVQPSRILAMATVIFVHTMLALMLLAPMTAPETPSKPRGGSEDGIRMTFINRASSQPASAPPPPPPEVVTAEPAPPALELVAATPELVEALQSQEVTAIAYDPPPQMDMSYDDGRLPFMTLDPVTVEEDPGEGPRIYGQAEELPGEYMEVVDVLPMELAQYRKVRQPAYLREARDAGEQGIVIVRVLVDEFGYPVGLKVMRSTAGQLLTLEALRAISTWQFKPAMRDGVAVKGAMLVPIYFFLDGLPPSLKQWQAMGGTERNDA